MCTKVINHLAPLHSVLISCFALKNIFRRELSGAKLYSLHFGAKIFMKTHFFDFYFLPVQTQFWEFFMLSKIKSFKKLNDFF